MTLLLLHGPEQHDPRDITGLIKGPDPRHALLPEPCQCDRPITHQTDDGPACAKCGHSNPA